MDGLYGALIVTSVEEDTLLAAAGAPYAVDNDEWILMVADWYATTAHTLVKDYLSPPSGGDEPMPDNFTVNGFFTDTLKISSVDKNGGAVRVRVINAAGFSMFTFSVDGMPLKVIEIDGVAVKPYFVSTFTVNVAQRVSFLLDWSLLDTTIASSNAIWFRFNGIPEMYPTYDNTVYANGLFGSTTNAPLNINWKGLIQFDVAPNYTEPPIVNQPIPFDDNMLEAEPLVPLTIPEPTKNINLLVVFSEEQITGVNKAYINGDTYMLMMVKSIFKVMQTHLLLFLIIV
jgi:FtsP/CotA-like multicopper oxidase with cupredoxin domain